jgi:hypothetical protein
MAWKMNSADADAATATISEAATSQPFQTMPTVRSMAAMPR